MWWAIKIDGEMVKALRFPEGIEPSVFDFHVSFGSHQHLEIVPVTVKEI